MCHLLCLLEPSLLLNLLQSMQAMSRHEPPGVEGLSMLLATHLLPKLRLRDLPALLSTNRWLRQLVTHTAGAHLGCRG